MIYDTQPTIYLFICLFFFFFLYNNNHDNATDTKKVQSIIISNIETNLII